MEQWHSRRKCSSAEIAQADADERAACLLVEASFSSEAAFESAYPAVHTKAMSGFDVFLPASFWTAKISAPAKSTFTAAVECKKVMPVHHLLPASFWAENEHIKALVKLVMKYEAPLAVDERNESLDHHGLKRLTGHHATLEFIQRAVEGYASNTSYHHDSGEWEGHTMNEMADQTKSISLPAGFWAENKHIKALVQHLDHWLISAVLDLPQATFDIIQPALVSVDTARRQLKTTFERRSCAYTREEWEEDTLGLGGELAASRLFRYSTIPGLWEDAIHEHISALRDRMECCFTDDPTKEHEPAMIEKADLRLREIVARRARVSRQQAIEWSPPFGLATIKRVCLDISSMSGRSGIYWYDWIHSVGPTIEDFPRTHDLIRQLHSREVGEMLAEKVAGLEFPAELVELLADCFYDKPLLLSLKLGRHGINES